MSSWEHYVGKVTKGESTLCPDPRYTTCNVTYWCYRSYLDWHRCTRLLGKGHKPCLYFRSTYAQLCPNRWVEEWDKQLEEGNFPGKLPPEPEEKETNFKIF